MNEEETFVKNLGDLEPAPEGRAKTLGVKAKEIKVENYYRNNTTIELWLEIGPEVNGPRMGQEDPNKDTSMQPQPPRR
ncbi:hypothetical protein HAX54_007865 [Datura stramonium]|uniref:Uncharacterized protein n=1 Tax=Datura stramonium TaxID=4076 RepID=A0ABS8TDQ5_DATST|nr:hypothetical protein [Datura stramonium]